MIRSKQLDVQAELPPYETATKDTLTRYLPRPEVHSMYNFQFFPWAIRVTSHTTSSPLPSPPTYDSLSLHHLQTQGSHFHCTFQLSHSLLLLSSNEKVVEASSALYFWDHHTQPMQPTEALDTALAYLSLANPVLKPVVYSNPGS